MKAARLAELLAQAADAPEGIAVRIDAKELLWLLECRDESRTALGSCVAVLPYAASLPQRKAIALMQAHDALKNSEGSK